MSLRIAELKNVWGTVLSAILFFALGCIFGIYGGQYFKPITQKEISIEKKDPLQNAGQFMCKSINEYRSCVAQLSKCVTMLDAYQEIAEQCVDEKIRVKR